METQPKSSSGNECCVHYNHVFGNWFFSNQNTFIVWTWVILDLVICQWVAFWSLHQAMLGWKKKNEPSMLWLCRFLGDKEMNGYQSVTSTVLSVGWNHRCLWAKGWLCSSSGRQRMAWLMWIWLFFSIVLRKYAALLERKKKPTRVELV